MPFALIRVSNWLNWLKWLRWLKWLSLILPSWFNSRMKNTKVFDGRGPSRRCARIVARAPVAPKSHEGGSTPAGSVTRHSPPITRRSSRPASAGCGRAETLDLGPWPTRRSSRKMCGPALCLGAWNLELLWTLPRKTLIRGLDLGRPGGVPAKCADHGPAINYQLSTTDHQLVTRHSPPVTRHPARGIPLGGDANWLTSVIRPSFFLRSARALRR